MKVEIKYRASVTDDKQVKVVDAKLFSEIGTYVDNDADISKFFSSIIDGLRVSGGSVVFEHDKAKNLIYCIATYTVDLEPSKAQLDSLVQQSTEQIDCGYYGEDGWFVDTKFGSFYIQLVDPAHRNEQPLSVTVY